MTHTLAWVRLSLAGCAVVAGSAGCGRETTPTPSGGATPSASATAAASSSAVPGGPACVAEPERVWVKGADARAGLTETKLASGKVAVGLAVGSRPHVLVVDASGNGELVALDVDGASPLAKRLDGTRHLQRVTPAAGSGGGVRGFVDYRDKRADGTRRVACGPVSSSQPLVEFDGKPLLDVDDTGKGRTAALASAAPPPGSAEAPPPGSGAGAGAAAPAQDMAVATRRELRDCRTIVDPGGEVAWALSSELEGKPAGDKTKWSMRFVSDSPGGKGRSVVHSIPLPAEPTKLHTFENAIAYRRENAEFVVAARYQGALWVWQLDSERRRKSGPRIYRGGYPTLPHFVADGADTLLLSALRAPSGTWGARWGRIGASGLPATLEPITVPDAQSSVSEPWIALLGAQRWLAHHAGDPKSPALRVVPVDARLAVQGPSFTVAEANVLESRTFAVGGGRLVAVYLRSGQSTELVSRAVRCGG